MTAETLLAAWNGFFFEPISVLPMAVFRIVFGCVLLIDGIYMALHAREYLGPRGLTEYTRYFKRTRGRALSLFLFLPNSMWSVRLILVVHLIAVLMVIAGCLTPWSFIVAFVTTRSIVSRQDHMTNGGDAIAKIMCFLMIFTPAGQALSVDAWMYGGDTEAAPWAQRLMQIQLCIIYFNTFYWKLKGATWRNGTAVYYAVSNRMYRKFRFPPFFLRTPYVQILTFGVLLLELVLGPGLWFDDLRPWLMAAAILMHLSFGFFLNVHLFGFYMIASLMTFLEPEWVAALLGGT
ncbi:HTTM domain-containing protein [uncultured Tateyamaria sp.]|uniref:HTTM domain-containing protein n=1 Tax=uncultured Tateyamaria sp. TaxID=455651 RepID=UPI002635C2CA|nr:HTTM domain-containing protein [uncultured Tateyamaria sp.]